MEYVVVTGASCVCTMGNGQGQVIATSQNKVGVAGRVAVCREDVVPMQNVSACGFCTSLQNPAVASATAAALGVLTPQPCVPAPVGPWKCGSKVHIGGKPVLTKGGTLQCTYGGTISIFHPGQTKVKG